MKKQNVNFLALGCRLNTLEAEKIKQMFVSAGVENAWIVNTCSVTGEAERQSKQAIRRIARENPNDMLFVTGCAVTRNPSAFAEICGVCAVVPNKDKFRIESYLPNCDGNKSMYADGTNILLSDFETLSKAFVQIQNGCNHNCAYCIVSQLRGKNVSFSYEKIAAQIKALVAAGYYEIVLTGVDIAGYIDKDKKMFLPDLVGRLLNDIPDIKRLRLSSLDPGTNLRPLIDIMRKDSRLLPHMHLSMQSGSDEMLHAMGRRHNAKMVSDLVNYANKYIGNNWGGVSFSWDLICGFPGETEKLFKETCDLIRKLKPIHLHAFPFSPRPGTPAATMQNQIDKQTSKNRVKVASDIACENKLQFMKTLLGKNVQVNVEELNIARDANDIVVRIRGEKVKPKSIVNVKLVDIIGEEFIGLVQ